MAIVTGTTGADVHIGKVDDDVIYGLAGNGMIDGVVGHDLNFGGAGVDNLSGGIGNDIFVEDTFPARARPSTAAPVPTPYS